MDYISDGEQERNDSSTGDDDNSDNDGSDRDSDDSDRDSDDNNDGIDVVGDDNDGDDDDGGGGDRGDDDNNDNLDEDTLRKISLIGWTIKHNIPHAALDGLLVVLRDYWTGREILPKCLKTLLGTLGARYVIRPMRDIGGFVGEFTYCGIQQGLEHCINPEAHETDDIDLQFHCDGLSVSKSSNSEIWPILCKVYSKSAKYEPFIVSMFHGQSKPLDVNDYLREFVREINQLLQDGVIVAGRQFYIHIQCIIADTPARAFLKSIQGHTGANACE